MGGEAAMASEHAVALPLLPPTCRPRLMHAPSSEGMAELQHQDKAEEKVYFTRL